MKRCLPCNKTFMSWSSFGRHMMRSHGIDSGRFWRRANQIGDEPCAALRSDNGRWSLMVQGRLL
jgi:hypothetical protein